MAGDHEHTAMGGLQQAFLTTHWSLVEHIQADEDKNRVLIGLLLDRYWKPIYCYLRHRGYDNEDAKDLTQGFFHEVVLNRNLAQRADQSKGRFRTFLLHALDQYLINERRKQDTQKRRPKGHLISLDVLDPPSLPQAFSEMEPEDAYNYAWTASMLDRILSEVKSQCRDDHLEVHWHVFHEKILQPIQSNTVSPSFAEICRKYDIDDQKKAANMVTTIKRRLQNALKQYLTLIATSDDEMHNEFAAMVQFFSKDAQNSG